MHAKGILHRDVKPDNIFLAHDDAGRWQPKLIDFGLARLEARPLSPITQRGMVVGTPVYLAPERMFGEDADPRNDVWSLCVALYEMVTGEVPFEGDHPAQVLLAVRRGEPASLASHGVDDPELWAILKRGLSRRSARWASVRALGEALARELWKRGVTQDISGSSLWPSWVDESDDLRPTTDAPPPGAQVGAEPGISTRAPSQAPPSEARLPSFVETLDLELPAPLRVTSERPAPPVPSPTLSTPAPPAATRRALSRWGETPQHPPAQPAAGGVARRGRVRAGGARRDRRARPAGRARRDGGRRAARAYGRDAPHARR